MNTTPPSHDDRATNEAIDWIIWLAEEPDDLEVRARFETWLAASAENQAAWKHAGKVSNLVGQSQKVAFIDAPSTTLSRQAERLRPRRWPTFVAAALAACLILTFAPDIMLHLRSDYRTGTAQQQSIALDDGSTIRLGPQSAVAVLFSDGQRDVRLLSGEAYFEVARDEHRPFRVLTNEAVTTVLGTGFDVRLGDESTDVSVRHGRVRVEYSGPPSVKKELIAGQWSSIKRGRIASGDGAASLVGSWSSGKLAVVDRPVGDVVADIRRYYRGFILLKNDRLSEQSASGSFDMGDPLSAITALVRPHGGTVRQITPWVIIIS